MAGGSYRDRMPTRVIFVEVANHEHDAEFGEWQLWKEWRCAAALCVEYSSGRVIGETGATFTDSGQLWLWIMRLCRSRKPVWLVANDLGSALTLSDLWSRVKRGGWKLSRVIMSDPPTVVTVEHERGTLQCVDFGNYAGASQLAPTVAGAHYAPELKPSIDDHLGWMNWCAERCRKLCHSFTSIMSFVSRFGSAVWSVSLSGIAWRIWKLWYSTQRIGRTSGEKERRIERASYYPGECAAYRTGSLAGAWTHCDVNSLYPWAMLHGLYPVSPLWEGNSCEPRELLSRCNDGVCTATVCLHSEDVYYPWRSKGQVHRCVGKFWTALAGCELRSALQSGHVLAVSEWVHYRADPLFVGWVTDMYAHKLRAKERGDREQEGCIKLLMNSLSGKFAQKVSEWVDRCGIIPPQPYGCWTHYDYDTGEARYYRAIAGHVQERQERKDWSESRPLIAACITAYGRERMRNLRQRVSPANVVYQDTDSLILRNSAWRKLVGQGEASNTRLGGLRELGTYDGAIVYGPKRYSLGGRITMAGVGRGQAVSVDGTYQRENQQTLASLTLKEPQRYVGLSRKTVRLRDLPPETCVCEDGTVLPLTLWED